MVDFRALHKLCLVKEHMCTHGTWDPVALGAGSVVTHRAGQGAGQHPTAGHTLHNL